MNLYGYTGNNPVNKNDPKGLMVHPINYGPGSHYPAPVETVIIYILVGCSVWKHQFDNIFNLPDTPVPDTIFLPTQ